MNLLRCIGLGALLWLALPALGFGQSDSERATAAAKAKHGSGRNDDSEKAAGEARANQKRQADEDSAARAMKQHGGRKQSRRGSRQ